MTSARHRGRAGGRVRPLFVVAGSLLWALVVAAGASAADPLDTPFAHPQYVVHAIGHGTTQGGVTDDFYTLLNGPPDANGYYTIPDGSGGTFTYKSDYSAGPFNTPRQVCDAAAAKGIPDQTWTLAYDYNQSFDCAAVYPPSLGPTDAGAPVPTDDTSGGGLTGGDQGGGPDLMPILLGLGGIVVLLGGGLFVGNALGIVPNWGGAVVPGALPGVPNTDNPDTTETVTDAQGNPQRTTTTQTDPVTGDVTVTTLNPQGTAINTVVTHVDPITGDTTTTRLNADGQPVLTQIDHTDPITGDSTVALLNPQGQPIRTTTSHVDPITGDVTVTVTNAQGQPVRTFTTHTDPITGDTTRTRLNPQGQPISTHVDHEDPITGDTTRTTLNAQGQPAATETWHADPITDDTTHTVLNPQGQPVKTEILHTDPVTGDITISTLNAQGQPVSTETRHDDPITGDTTLTTLNPQGQPVKTVIDHTDPITDDHTTTTLNAQGQPVKTVIDHTDPITDDHTTVTLNPQGQPVTTEVFHTDPITGDTSCTTLNAQGQVQHTTTVHQDPVTGLWVAGPPPPAPPTMAPPPVAPEPGSGLMIVDGGPQTALAGVGPVAPTGSGTGTSGPTNGAGQPPGSGASQPPDSGSGQPPGTSAGQPSSAAPPAPPLDPALEALTHAGTTSIPAADAYPVLHALIPSVGADGTVAGLNLGAPTVANGAITVNTPLGPATATLGIDASGHLTATITALPNDPTGFVLPSQAEMQQGVKNALDAYNQLLDAHGVHLASVVADNGSVTLTSVPNAAPPAGPPAIR